MVLAWFGWLAAPRLIQTDRDRKSRVLPYKQVANFSRRLLRIGTSVTPMVHSLFFQPVHRKARIKIRSTWPPLHLTLLSWKITWSFTNEECEGVIGWRCQCVCQAVVGNMEVELIGRERWGIPRNWATSGIEVYPRVFRHFKALGLKFKDL